MKKHSLIRTIYLYLFALLGLVLLTIAGVRFIDMGLKEFIFTKAYEEERMYSKQPPMPFALERLEQIESSEGNEFTAQERAETRRMIQSYKEWQEESEKIDPVTSRQHRDASFNLSMILIGLPLYLYHWSVIRRETKKND